MVRHVEKHSPLSLRSRSSGRCPRSHSFLPAFVQNTSYWNDGKAEFNIYDAPKLSLLWLFVVLEPQIISNGLS